MTPSSPDTVATVEGLMALVIKMRDADYKRDLERGCDLFDEIEEFATRLASPAPTPVADADLRKIAAWLDGTWDGADTLELKRLADAVRGLFTHPATTTAPRLPVVRVLTEEELRSISSVYCVCNEDPELVQRKFCEVNGLELSHPVAPLSEGAARHVSVHQAVSTSSGATPGLTGEAVPLNAAAPTGVDAPSREKAFEMIDVYLRLHLPADEYPDYWHALSYLYTEPPQ